MSHPLTTFVYFASLAALALSQNGLTSFDEIRADLESGRRLLISLDSRSCSHNLTVGNDEVTINGALSHWQISIRGEAMSSIRADDYGVYGRGSLGFLIRSLDILSDDSVRLWLDNTDDGEEPGFMECVLGEGAVVRRLEGENDLEQLETYDALKSALLLGKPVQAVVSLSSCLNSDDVIPDGLEFSNGFPINNIAVLNDGSEEEFIATFEAALIASPTSSGNLAAGAESMIIPRAGDALVRLATFDLGDGFQSDIQATLACPLDSFKFVTPSGLEQETLTTYASVKSAALDESRDMVFIVRPPLCESLGGIGSPVEVGLRRFDQFQIFPVGENGDETEFLEFTIYTLDVDGRIITDSLRVYADDSAVLEYGFIELLNNGTQTSGLLGCPLADDGARFEVARRTRNPLVTFEEIAEATRTGFLLKAEVNFEECVVENKGPLGTMGATLQGVLWQTVVGSGEEQYLFGSTTALVDATDDTGLATGALWRSATFTLYPVGTVFVGVSAYDFFDGRELASALLVCELKTENSGSVGFYAVA